MGLIQVRVSAIACASACVFASPLAYAGQRSPSPPISAGFGSSAAMSTLSGAHSSAASAVDVPFALPASSDPIDAAEPTAGSRAYARRGVVELGGFANFSGANHFTSIQVSPTVGFFVFDGFELSAIVGLNYVRQMIDVGLPSERLDQRAILRILAEPSYHLPISRSVWGFVGVGLGIAATPRNGGTHTGFDIAPRAGANFLVGTSGLVTPAAFLDYTGESVVSAGGVTGVRTTYGIEAGYTVVW